MWIDYSFLYSFYRSYLLLEYLLALPVEMLPFPCILCMPIRVQSSKGVHLLLCILEWNKLLSSKWTHDMLFASVFKSSTSVRSSLTHRPTLIMTVAIIQNVAPINSSLKSQKTTPTCWRIWCKKKQWPSNGPWCELAETIMYGTSRL